MSTTLSERLTQELNREPTNEEIAAEMEIEVDKVSGSSLTSGGFNEAIEQIKQEAQA